MDRLLVDPAQPVRLRVWEFLTGGLAFAATAARLHMAKSKRQDTADVVPHGQRDRDSADEQPSKTSRKSHESTHESDAAEIDAAETFQPDRDGTGF